MRRGVEMWGESQSPAHSIGTIPLALQSRVRQATEWPRRRAPKYAWGRVSGMNTEGGDSDDRAAAGGGECTKEDSRDQVDGPVFPLRNPH